MKRRISCILQRPFCVLIFLILAVLSLSGSLVPLWMNRAKRIESEVKFVANSIRQQLVSEFQKTAAFLAPFNASAVSLSQVLNSSLDASDLVQFSGIRSKLFQAFSTIPYLKQISYIGLDGLFFSYYADGDQTVAVYSNSTFSLNDTTNYTWHKQLVDGDTGEVFGEVMKSPPFGIVNSSWFAEAMTRKNGYASVGTGWGKSQETLLLTTAGMQARGAISLAFSVKTLVDHLTSGIHSYNGSLYLATDDGIVLNHDGQFSEQGRKITCQPHNNGGYFEEPALRRISDQKYAVHCSQIELMGLQLVYAITLPGNAFSGLLEKNIRLTMVLLVLMIGGMVLMICSFIYLIIEAAKKEMHLCRALINQMEATQQSEKKSMNKSLAFASASHDIRAALAALSGLIEICCRQVSGRVGFRSDLMTNLQQMEICTKDLLGILNTILDTSKIEAGKMQLEEEEFGMDELIEDVVDLYHPVGMKKGVDVIFDPYDGSITKFSWVKGDRSKLKQILSNLLSNAVKFTPDGHVTVRAWAKKPCRGSRMLVSDGRSPRNCPLCFLFKNRRSSSELETANDFHSNPNCMEFVFEVNDTGKGILKEKRKSVFENYVQVNETAFGQEGTGLGLGIVQSLVRLMGGEIKILDKDLGERGTCIRFNVFMTTVEADNTSKNARRISDIESSSGHYILSDSFHHWSPFIRHQRPKNEGSQVILFIKSPQRGLILKRFMERLKIKVHVIENHKLLSPTLKRIKRRLNLSRYSSSSTNSKSEGMVTSSNRSKEAPLSALDGTDEASPPEKKNAFILIVMDTHAGPFREMSRALVEFRRDLNEDCCCRVVWLDVPDANSTRFYDLHEKLPPSDFVLSKPLHGSRLYQTIKLLPEFGAIPPPGGEIHHDVGRAPARSPIHIETSRSSNRMANTSGAMGNSSSASYKKAEIEEVEGKPLLGRTILVVDDDPIGQKIATSVVSRLGAITFSCRTGEEACALVSTRLNGGTTARATAPFDCILMDCEMPVMNGITATRRIRKSEENYVGVHTPILALTAHDKGEEIGSMVEAGVDGYITKPLNQDNFLKALAHLG